jgi:hypothetical protein
MARRGSAGPDLAQAGIDQLVHEIGVRVGTALGAAFTTALATTAQGARSSAGRPAVGGSPPCRVSGCLRRRLAKGLCATHYRKARRIGLAEPFDAKALAELSTDGRKLRGMKSR